MEREAGGGSHQELLSSPLVGSSHHFPHPSSPSQVKQRSKMDSLSFSICLVHCWSLHLLANSQERNQEWAQNRSQGSQALWLDPSAGVYRKSLGNFISEKAPGWCGQEANGVFFSLCSPCPTPTAKAVDGYVKPLIRQVVPE